MNRMFRFFVLFYIVSWGYYSNLRLFKQIKNTVYFYWLLLGFNSQSMDFEIQNLQFGPLTRKRVLDILFQVLSDCFISLLFIISFDIH